MLKLDQQYLLPQATS